MVDSTHPFLSTSSARRTTRQVRPAVRGRPISIHVLREEDDCDRGEVEPGGAYISIHVLREEDDQAGGDVVVPVGQFLSTSSARRTTVRLRHRAVPCANFYPRPPRGGRRIRTWHRPKTANFYPRPPRGGRPATLKRRQTVREQFLSTSSARRTTRAFRAWNFR